MSTPNSQANIPAVSICPLSLSSTSMHLYHGFMAEKKGLAEIDMDDYQGHVGLVGSLGRFAIAIEAALEMANAWDYDHPGVAMYEVVEPAGEWIRSNLGATDTQFVDEIIDSLNLFFMRDCSALRPVIAHHLGGYVAAFGDGISSSSRSSAARAVGN